MTVPRWAKPILIFLAVIMSVVLVASAFFAYTAATNPLQTTKRTPAATLTPSTQPSPAVDTSLAEPNQLPQKNTPTTSLQLDPNKLFLLINAHRENFNVPKLRPNTKLTASAQLKLDDMIDKQYYRHADENDQSTWHFIQVTGYQYSKAGENLAFNIGSEWEIFQAWVRSETHNKQMLDPAFTDIGIAIDCTSIEEPNYKCITVAHFGKE